MKNFTKNKYFRTIACLGVGVVVLSAAVFANYDNANGYTTYKNALKQIPFEENVSVNMQVDLELDGASIATAKNTIVYDKNSDVSMYETSSTQTVNSETENHQSESYRQNGFSIHTNDYGRGKNYTISRSSRSGLLFSEDDQEMVSKVINFGELLADGFVGDLKNNFVLTGGEDGDKTYEITLTEAQVPAIVNAGVSLVASTMKTSMDNVNGGVYTSENELDRVLNEIMLSDKDPYVSYANCQLTVNKNDKLTNNKLTGTLTGFDNDGNEHQVTIKINADLYDYGTSQPQGMDLSALPFSFTMKDGSVKTVQDLMNGNDRVNALKSDFTYLYINPVDYSSYTSETPESKDLYFYEGKEVNSEEYYSQSKQEDGISRHVYRSTDEFNASINIESEEIEAEGNIQIETPADAA